MDAMYIKAKDFRYHQLFKDKKNDVDSRFPQLLSHTLRGYIPEAQQRDFVEKASISTDAMVSPDVRKTNPLISLGVISQDNPTVSNLLIEHPEYGRKCWRIIHSNVNESKPYTKIPAGTAIFLNPDTMELVWENNGLEEGLSANYAQHSVDRDVIMPSKKKNENDQFSENLVRVIEPYMGKPYDEIDCYELIVKGLNKMGVRYLGRGGLKERLVQMAAKEGLPYNTYLSGEGLIEASGSNVYQKSLQRIIDPPQQALEVSKEMRKYNKKGLILSFSTPTRGHTGILSHKGNEWTFINSGRLDNHIANTDMSKGVGEERLDDEIQNWFRLAGLRNEPLRITLGQLDAKKLMVFRSDTSPGADKNV